MYKVLLVEDELLVRVGLKSSIDWNRFGMTVVGEAANGQAAWEIYEREHPDVVLTDLKMPVMDGMELIRRIRQVGGDTKILILTCVEEFALAQEAIRMGVSGYILKLTMTMEEIAETLEGLRRELDRAGASAASVPAPPSGDAWLAALQGHLFYGTHSEADFFTRLNAGGERLGPTYTVAVLQLDQYEQLRALYRDEQGGMIHYAMQNILTEIVARHGGGVTAQLSSFRYLVLLRAAGRENAQRFYEDFSAVMMDYFHSSASLAAHYAGEGQQPLREAYRCSEAALQSCFFLGGGQALLPGAYSEKEVRGQAAKKLEAFREALPEELRDAFAAGDGGETALRAGLEALWHATLQHSGLPPERYPEQLRRFAGELAEAKTLEGCLAVYSRLAGGLQDAGGIQCSREIAAALAFVAEHYAEPLSLRSVADAVGLSPNYLSNLFKKEVGMPLFDHINRRRIKQAMHLLSTTTLRTYEIAYAVGFSDESYFSRTFKRITGQRPNEYKKTTVDLEGSL